MLLRLGHVGFGLDRRLPGSAAPVAEMVLRRAKRRRLTAGLPRSEQKRPDS